MGEKQTAAEAKPLNWRSPATYKELGLELYHEFSRDKVTTLAAAVAYYTVFAIPALLIIIVMGAAVVNRVTDVAVVENLRKLIIDHAPASTRQLLLDQVDSAIAKVGGAGLSIGLIVTAVIALWSGSSAISAMIVAFNRAYGVEEGRPFVKLKGVTLGLTLLLAVFINLAFVLLVFGGRIGSWFADRIGAGSAFNVVWNLARGPLSIVAIAILLALLYYWGPNVEQSFRWISPGSVLATILWLIATAGFGIYLRISNPGSAYGVVGSVLVLLFFLYVSAVIFIVGAEVNAMLAKRADPKAIDDLATKPEASPETRAQARQRQHQMG